MLTHPTESQLSRLRERQPSFMASIAVEKAEFLAMHAASRRPYVPRELPRPDSGSSLPASRPPSRPSSVPDLSVHSLPTRTGSPLWSRKGTATIGNMQRYVQSSDMLYTGKDSPRRRAIEQTKLGRYGPGRYDVRVSRTGTPRGRVRSTPIWSVDPRVPPTPTEKLYEGRALAYKNMARRGKIGADRNYEPRVSNTGTPRGHTRGTPIFPSRPQTAPSSSPTAEDAAAEANAPPRPTSRQEVRRMYDVRGITRTGENLYKAKGVPIFGTPAPRPGDKNYSSSSAALVRRAGGRAGHAVIGKQGAFGPGNYSLPSSIGQQVLSAARRVVCPPRTLRSSHDAPPPPRSPRSLLRAAPKA